MGIKHLHTTIDYKKLIEDQANMVVDRSYVPPVPKKTVQKGIQKKLRKSSIKRS